MILPCLETHGNELFRSRAHTMTTHVSQDAAEEPSPLPLQRIVFWKKAVIGASVVLLVGLAWRAVYVSNQNEMKLRRAVRKSQSIRGALCDVPARRFSTIDARPAAAQKNILV
nr:unnamed protein product [Leishmania braziliensis]CAJ2478987.1 unnamed protein product [Leishmania braziliensis]